MVVVPDERDARIANLEAQVAALIARIAELEARLAQNSSNSNRPPSSDAPADRDARRGRPSSGRPRGGQRGHKAWKRTPLPPEKVNRTQDCFPEHCRRRGCGKRLPRRSNGEPLHHQVVEVPAMKPDVTDYLLHAVTCTCGKVTRARVPAGVPRGMCGPRLMALIGMLTGVYKLSRREAGRLLGDVLGIDISLGALSEAEGDVSESVVVPVEEARVYASEQTSKNVDATGWRQAGQARTLWDDRDAARDGLWHRDRRQPRRTPRPVCQHSRHPHHRPRHAIRLLGDGQAPDLLGRT